MADEAVIGEAAENLRAWVDRAMQQRIPENVVAFCFNLYEAGDAFGVELVGASRFDPINGDWACDETFEYRRDEFTMPVDMFGGSWEACLENVGGILRAYLHDGAFAARLRSAQGVAVGFVDGDIQVLWPIE